jgi:hypothetical protein
MTLYETIQLLGCRVSLRHSLKTSIFEKGLVKPGLFLGARRLNAAADGPADAGRLEALVVARVAGAGRANMG